MMADIKAQLIVKPGDTVDKILRIQCPDCKALVEYRSSGNVDHSIPCGCPNGFLIYLNTALGQE